MIYELREYTAVPGAAEALNERFARDTLDIFVSNGIHVLGFWHEAGDPGRIVYLAAFADEQERSNAWARFKADETWQRVKAESEAGGPIVAEQNSRVLEAPDYWTARSGRAEELRS